MRIVIAGAGIGGLAARTVAGREHHHAEIPRVASGGEAQRAVSLALSADRYFMAITGEGQARRMIRDLLFIGGNSK
jgi:hypothetical protein